MKQLSNHFYPFFWQHGEDEQVLREYVEKIYESGMRGVCIESRPHPDFLGDKWWEDLNVIITECEKRNMKIWILDDALFPTGYANGKIKENHPELKKLFLMLRRYDIAGPFKGARIDTSVLKGRQWGGNVIHPEKIIGIYLTKRSRDLGDKIDYLTMIDITTQYKENTIYVDVPEGDWSVLVVFTTYDGGEEGTKDYLNPLQKEATQVLIDEVYEKHFKNCGKYFGTTIEGFFSDEPRFGNVKGGQWKLGSDMPLPWRPKLELELKFDNSYLPLLWIESLGHEEREIRYEYMDLITKLYRDNFVKPLADWCTAHQVIYTGHNVEDNGAHSRLGYGTGHFFRGQEYQHISGIDVIGGQIVPGMPYHHDAFQTGGSDGHFFHYALAKLGASAAHLTPEKKGRAMCEAFGAYGWNEGIKTMKWIADHLMVRGINYLVPHAFSPKAFPDFDCPPHFYAHGHNPQYRYMSRFTDYINRTMSILSNGIHRAPVAVFYPAELEWVGEAMPVEDVVQKLTTAQIDVDIVSNDMLEAANVDDQGCLCINQERFKALVVPYAQYIPEKVVSVINSISEQGCRVICVNSLPENSQKLSKKINVITLEQLQEKMTEYADILTEQKQDELVYYQYEKEGKTYILFFNESLYKRIDTKIELKGKEKNIIAYDTYDDMYYEVKDNRLLLAPYQTILWIVGADAEMMTEDSEWNQLLLLKKEPIHATWTVSFAETLEYPRLKKVGEMSEIKPLNCITGYEHKVGTVSYETTLYINNPEEIEGIDIGLAYETAEVFVNGKKVGTKIAPPYCFRIEEVLQTGENKIKIEVTNTLGTQFHDGLTQYLAVEPFGLTETVSLLKK